MTRYAASIDDILEEEEHYADQLKEYLFYAEALRYVQKYRAQKDAVGILSHVMLMFNLVWYPLVFLSEEEILVLWSLCVFVSYSAYLYLIVL